MTETLVRYENPADGVARIMLARADKYNAINPSLIFAVNEAFDKALADDSVKVIILGADGKHFSAGHDIAETVEMYQADMQERSPRISTWSGFNEPGAHGWYASEKEGYLEIARRWRNISKPTICAVQGKCIAGALIFAWVCDIIIASKDAVFSDPVTTFGMPAVEWLGHPWELGARKAKEFLFTSDSWSRRGSAPPGHGQPSGRARRSRRLHARDGAENRDQTGLRAQAGQGSGQQDARHPGPGERDRRGVLHSTTSATTRISGCSDGAWTRPTCPRWRMSRRRLDGWNGRRPKCARPAPTPGTSSSS